MKPNPIAVERLGLWLVAVLAFTNVAPAAVTNVAWYRLGETDAGAVSGATANSTSQNLVGTNHLLRSDSPTYSSAISAAAANRVGSSLGVHFNGSQYFSNVVVSTVINNFCLEAWVNPDTTAVGNRFIVCNGSTLSDGWAIFQKGGSAYSATFGGVTSFGTPTATSGTWTHLALVRDSGTATFYVDGVAAATSISNPIAPASGFTVATRPQASAGQSFIGTIDEVRVFRFGAGQFSTNDLLLNAQRVTSSPATALIPGGATLNGSVNALGLPTSAWFAWGATTNYGNTTTTQSFNAGTTTANFSRQITGLAPHHAYHYRAVCSNSLGVATGNDMTLVLTNVASGSAGGGQPISLLQPCVELNFMICTNGIYPSPDGGGDQPFLGEVRLFAGSVAPAGWMFCHGQLLSADDYLALFSIIGTIYGGDGVTNFALPDLRGRVAVSSGQGPGLADWIVGEVSGLPQSTLTVQELPTHIHTLPAPFVVSGPAGGSQPRFNRQSTLGINFLINIAGIYPGGAQVFEPFIGQMPIIAGDFAPRSTALAWGQTFAISQNTALFSLLVTNYGGNGQTTFQLPDLRGRSPMGVGQGAGLSTRLIGQKPGVETVTMATNQMPAHLHVLPSYPPPLGNLTGAAGSNQPQTVVQPAQVVQFLISTNGELPSTTSQATNRMIGEIAIYAGTNLPGGWAVCNGQQLNVAAYPQLFGVISDRFGGNGITTFALPDLRGRVPVGATNGQPGLMYGAEEFVLTEAQMPAHTHPIPALDFTTWCNILGLPGAAFDADADGDSASNGLEWTAGTGLTNATSLPKLSIASDGAQAKIGFSRNTNATDVTIYLQRTPTLSNGNAWSGLVTNIAGAWTMPGIVSEIGTNYTKAVEVSDRLTNNPAADYRLQITRP